MQILYLIALTAIVVTVPGHSFVISAKNDTLNCDGLICPEGSTSCIVSKKTFGDLSKYKYVRICADDNGLPTDSKTDELENPYPGTEMNTISLYDGNQGNQELVEAVREELEEEIDTIREETDNIVQETKERVADCVENANGFVKNTMSYWKKWTSDFVAKMKRMFPPGFPFVK